MNTQKLTETGVRFHLWLTKKQYNILKGIAGEKAYPVSAIIRQQIDKFISEEADKNGTGKVL